MARSWFVRVVSPQEEAEIRGNPESARGYRPELDSLSPEVRQQMVESMSATLQADWLPPAARRAWEAQVEALQAPPRFTLEQIATRGFPLELGARRSWAKAPSPLAEAVGAGQPLADGVRLADTAELQRLAGALRAFLAELEAQAPTPAVRWLASASRERHERAFELASLLVEAADQGQAAVFTEGR
jgi:hypothetical protein